LGSFDRKVALTLFIPYRCFTAVFIVILGHKFLYHFAHARSSHQYATTHSSNIDPAMVAPSHVKEEMANKREQRSSSPSLVPKCPSSPSSKKRTRVYNKYVSFNENVRLRRTMALDDYTEEEVCATWFQKDEFDRIKSKVLLLVRKIERDGAEIGQGKKYCIRGLESLLPERSEMKAEARRKVTTAVFLEQDRQCLSDFVNVEAIAIASTTMSAKSQLMAVFTGHQDQQEAHRVYSAKIQSNEA
jgi:hypothetical protein